MSAITLCAARLLCEEGVRQYAYDDATGARVRAPKGHLSWGVGFNLDAIGEPGLFEVMLCYLLRKIAAQLATTPWYPGLPDGVASVCLDIAYNAGLHGLLGYPHMIHFMALKDWQSAAAQCRTTKPELAGRYTVLAEIVAKGE